jgi:formylglycine-generating enzyme required for sulfatase activity
MGSPEDEADREDNETQHLVTLTKGFWMAKTETTQGHWERVMRENPSDFSGEDLPVETVSWVDVQGWLEKMNEKAPLPSGWKWALPTEAQWEYACRAGTKRAFAGDLDEMAWYDENSGSKTNPVGTKKANAWGLHDMHGNVWEWCSDRYGEYVIGSSSDPTGGATTGGSRVLRGGSWDYYAQHCRSADRSRVTPGNRLNSLGFRPALVPSIR